MNYDQVSFNKVLKSKDPSHLTAHYINTGRMEQVDQIIIVTLRDLGLEIDSAEIVSISQFNDQLVVQSVARCLNIINNNKNKLPEKLPEGMARRYRVGIELANACKELGFVFKI